MMRRVDAYLLLAALALVVCAGLWGWKMHLEVELEHTRNDQALVERLMRALDAQTETTETFARAEITTLRGIIGVGEHEAVEVVAGGEVGQAGEEQRRDEAAVERSSPIASRWDVPTDPADLDVAFEDPTDLDLPLDQLEPIPDAIAPEGEQGWADTEPVPFPEPVPEGEWRERIQGIGAGENPFPELGIKPAWHED